MKWLLLFPAWIILASYVIYRVKEANQDVPEASAQGVGIGASSYVLPSEDAEAGASRAEQVDGSVITREAIDFHNRVALLPIQSEFSGISPLWSPLDGGGGEEAFGLAQRSEFSNWCLFEAPELSFYYPEESGFRVEELAGDQSLSMLGGIFYRSDVSPDRWYRVVGPGELTWCAIGIDSSPDFDLTERYPNPESFHKLLLSGGGVARVSSGADGVVRRVQWLANGCRVTLLDWQHGSVHHEAYMALAASVRIAESFRKTSATLGEIVGGRSGIESRLGLLERGMTEKEVVSVLGEPAGMADQTWVYHVPEPSGDRFFRVGFVAGEFHGFRDDWINVRKDPPIKGSVEWMLEKTGIDAGKVGGIGYDLGVLTDEEVHYIFAEARQRMPAAGGTEWDGFCRIMANLAEMRMEDEGVLNVLRKRFLEPGMNGVSAAPILRAWDPAGSRELFAAKCRDILGDLRWKSATPKGGGKMVDDLQTLMAYTGADFPGVGDVVADASRHPHEAVRSVGISFCQWLELDARRPLLISGLEDSSEKVRRRCADALGADELKRSDLPFLEARLAKESDSATKEGLARAIDVIRGNAAGPQDS